jgi:lipoate-protein ligase A
VSAARHELVLPALLLRSAAATFTQFVHVYVPHQPTVAFSIRDLRSPGIADAVAVARSAGFEACVRSPGGRMVAYDQGAVVIDHVDRTAGIEAAGDSRFEATAAAHAVVLRRLGVEGVQVGEVEGEYCPGRFSVNVAGTVKVLGSAQRVTATGALSSTVIQVDMSERVRAVLTDVSAALGYDLRPSTVGDLRASAPTLDPVTVAAAFVDDYRGRLGAREVSLPSRLEEHALSAPPSADPGTPFDADDWTRTHPVPPS